MSPRRALACLSCCLTLLVTPGAAAQTTGRGSAPTAAPTAKRSGAARKPAARPPAATRSRQGKAGKKPAADCDVPADKATLAAKAPLPVAADPLAPTVAPCPPGTPGPGTP